MRTLAHQGLIGAGLIGALALGGCVAAPPSGPSVMALPGQDKSFEAFQADDATCRQFALAQTGYTTPSDAATQSAIGSTTVGTIAGAALGAAIGAAAGNPAAGAAIGAGSGFVVGGATGLSAAQSSGYSVQRRYDVSYVQCMAAKGENVSAATPTLAAAYPPYPGSYPAYYPYYPYPYYYPYYGGVFIGARFGGHHHFHHRR